MRETVIDRDAEVYRALRDLCVDEPWEAWSGDIAARVGCSKGRVRAALYRLQAHGFVWRSCLFTWTTDDSVKWRFEPWVAEQKR